MAAHTILTGIQDTRINNVLGHNDYCSKQLHFDARYPVDESKGCGKTGVYAGFQIRLISSGEDSLGTYLDGCSSSIEFASIICVRMFLDEQIKWLMVG